MSGEPEDVCIRDERQPTTIYFDVELDDAGLSPDAYRAYGRIVRRAGGARGHCRESVPNMAEACRMSERQFHRALQELQQRCMVVGERRPGRPTVYRVLDKAKWQPLPHRQGSATPATQAEVPLPHRQATPATQADEVEPGSRTTEEEPLPHTEYAAGYADPPASAAAAVAGPGADAPNPPGAPSPEWSDDPLAPASIYMPPDPFQVEPNIQKCLGVLARRHPDARHRLGTAARGLKWKGRHEGVVAACILRDPDAGLQAMSTTYQVADEHGGKALTYFRRVYEALQRDEGRPAREPQGEPEDVRRTRERIEAMYAEVYSDGRSQQ